VMRGPNPDPLNLTEVEHNELERLVRRHTTAQQVARRGRIILEADAGKNNSQIARELGLSVETVRAWRKRWLALQPVALADLTVEDRLSDVPRPGRRSQISAEQTCQLIAMACEQPKDRPISQWTGREIADEAMARGIVKQISPRHAARLLKKGISSRI
jgi:putative transposase